MDACQAISIIKQVDPQTGQQIEQQLVETAMQMQQGGGQEANPQQQQQQQQQMGQPAMKKGGVIKKGYAKGGMKVC